MAGRKSSVLASIMSPTPIRRLTLEGLPEEEASQISEFSFKHWHKRMQEEHEILRKSGKQNFGLWKWCYKGCTPCRWFDSIDYEVKICKYCMKFKTFKLLGTLVLIFVFMYVFMYSFLNDELLPGGTIFFLFLLIFLAYIAGFLLMFISLPSMMGNLLVGIIFGNLPTHWLPHYDEVFLKSATKTIEKISLLIALIRAGLLLDVSRIKGRVQFIFRISFFPLICEMAFVCLSSHFFLKLPWDWSALQGTILSVVSLASVTSVMEKNKQSGYGEDKHLSTVLIAASALDVIFGIFGYVIFISYIFAPGGPRVTFWQIFSNVVKQIVLGLSVGILSGLLVAFFPDKRQSQAASLRIIVIGSGTFAIASILNSFDMPAAGALGAIIMCLIASNMWEELGWHESSNPVQYFYTLAYYFGQPAALSLVGFSMNFTKSQIKEIGLSIVVIITGLIGRESICFITTLGKLYPTTTKEKLFICLAWFSKGTFQALLAYAAEYVIFVNTEYLSKDTVETYLEYSRCIKQTTVLAILLTTPLACYALTLFSPILLTRNENREQVESPPNPQNPESPG